MNREPLTREQIREGIRRAKEREDKGSAAAVAVAVLGVLILVGVTYSALVSAGDKLAGKPWYDASGIRHQGSH